MVIAPYFTENSAAFNALFIQPTPWCARDCFGCYVKGFEKLQSVTDSNDILIGDLISEIGIRVLVNQVTLAIDKKPGVDNNYDTRAGVMSNIVDEFIEAAQRCRRDKVQTEFHGTVHTIADLAYYENLWKRSDILLDMISISHLDKNSIGNIPRVRKFISPNINWNLTIDPTVNLDKIKESFQTIAEVVDTIYLVLHKPNLGLYFDHRSFEVHQDFIKFIKTMPVAIQNKVTVDGCISDSTKFLSTGYGCSSNVSRFQVWPNGSITGCAYNQNKITPPATNMKQLFQNFIIAKNTYEFNSCKIPNHLDSKNKFVKQRHNSYLEIIS